MLVEELDATRVIPQHRPRGCWILLRVDIAQAFLHARRRAALSSALLNPPTVQARSVLDFGLTRDYPVPHHRAAILAQATLSAEEASANGLPPLPLSADQYAMYMMQQLQAHGSSLPRGNRAYRRILYPDSVSECILASWHSTQQASTALVWPGHT